MAVSDGQGLNASILMVPILRLGLCVIRTTSLSRTFKVSRHVWGPLSVIQCEEVVGARQAPWPSGHMHICSGRPPQTLSGNSILGQFFRAERPRLPSVGILLLVAGWLVGWDDYVTLIIQFTLWYHSQAEQGPGD